jgi:shikimate dehydrogenase
MIDGHTQLVGLIGWPVEHTLSPAMHNAAFDALGLNWRYLPLPVPPGQVGAAVKGVAALGFRGANVTVPHKQAVMPVLDSIAPDAKSLGAVNTLVIERGEEGQVRIGGHNTDAQGFVGALRHGGFDPKGKSAVVVGAGGGARAVVYGLLEAGAQEILMFDLELSRAQALVSDLGGVGTNCAHCRSRPRRSSSLPAPPTWSTRRRWGCGRAWMVPSGPTACPSRGT